ncbi:hypothetical protein O0D83_03650 [Staphylococcus pseudintermedius]|nr:hypothetical protein [Staphylococcus pseudintermedius]
MKQVMTGRGTGKSTETVCMLVRDFLKINFDTMTTSHWSVQKFEE